MSKELKNVDEIELIVDEMTHQFVSMPQLVKDVMKTFVNPGERTIAIVSLTKYMPLDTQREQFLNALYDYYYGE